MYEYVFYLVNQGKTNLCLGIQTVFFVDCELLWLSVEVKTIANMVKIAFKFTFYFIDLTYKFVSLSIPK